MRSLKECYEIAKQHHYYWVGGNTAEFMCLALRDALSKGKLTTEEALITTTDVESLVHSIGPAFSTLMGALRRVYANISDTDVKNFWDKYIDNLEN